MRKIFLLFLILLIFLLQGCNFFRRYNQLVMLKRLGQNRKEIENYIKRQEASFDKLKDDLKNNRLKKGTLKPRILSLYGEPVFCKPEAEAEAGEVCLYRYPTEYFSADKIYLHFKGDAFQSARLIEGKS